MANGHQSVCARELLIRSTMKLLHRHYTGETTQSSWSKASLLCGWKYRMIQISLESSLEDFSLIIKNSLLTTKLGCYLSTYEKKSTPRLVYQHEKQLGLTKMQTTQVSISGQHVHWSIIQSIMKAKHRCVFTTLINPGNITKYGCLWLIYCYVKKKGKTWLRAGEGQGKGRQKGVRGKVWCFVSGVFWFHSCRLLPSVNKMNTTQL